MMDINDAIQAFEEALNIWARYLTKRDRCREERKDLPEQLKIAEAGLAARPDSLVDKNDVSRIRQQVLLLDGKVARLSTEYGNLPNAQQLLRNTLDKVSNHPNYDLRTMPEVAAFDQRQWNLSSPDMVTIDQAREAVRELRAFVGH